MQFNIIVIDKQCPHLPDGLAELRGDQNIRIAAWSSSVGDAGPLCAAHRPDVLLLSVECIRDTDGAWLAHLRQSSVNTRVLLVGDTLSDETLMDCLAMGVRGYVQQAEIPINYAIRAVRQGEIWISRKLARRVIDRLINRDRLLSAPPS